MVDQEDKVIYTEQAKNLRTTMKTYATSDSESKVLIEVTKGNIKEIKIFCCQTELDAVILEHYFINSGLYLGRYNNQLTKVKKEGLFKETRTSINGDFGKEKSEAPRSLAEEVQRFLAANNTLVNILIEQQDRFNEHFLNVLDKNGEQIETLAKCIGELTEGVKFKAEIVAEERKNITL
ncbi:hypothetical protein ABEX78_21175 [Priestia megaterium]